MYYLQSSFTHCPFAPFVKKMTIDKLFLLISFISGDPVIATKIASQMGSPWHSLIYFPLIDRFIYYQLFSCVKINYCHCH